MNGHKNWNHWNVSLWFANDEGLYRMALEAIRQTKTLDQAAEQIHEVLEGMETPDGAKYSRTAIRAAIRDLT